MVVTTGVPDRRDELHECAEQARADAALAGPLHPDEMLATSRRSVARGRG